MVKKILKTIVIFFLVLFPFLAGSLTGKFSPYVEGNSMSVYVAVYLAFTLVTASVLFFAVTRFKHWFEQPISGGVILFFIGCVMTGIAGLAAAPDLGIEMLKHPEREHARYILLFAGALLFGAYFIYHLRGDYFKLKQPLKWVITVLFVLAFVEMIWEFSHHYLYPEALKKWVAEGKNAEDFVKNYDNFTIVTIGAAGRFVQFALIMWLSLQLYKLRKVNIWSPVLTSILSLLGILSAVIIVITEMHYPKGFEFLFLFFIPGIPFLLLYWISVALLTRKPVSVLV